MDKRLYKPIYDDNGKLDHYEVIDRDTGEMQGVRGPDFRESTREYIKSLKSNPITSEAMEELLQKERQTETNARLRKLEEKLVDVPVSNYMNIQQAATYLDVSVPTIRRRIKEGKLPDRKVAGKYQIRKVELDAYRESLTRVVPRQDIAEKVLGRRHKVDNDKIARNLGLGRRRKK